ncbi:cytochrome p450 [Moniliophthora roreri]|nr:cytochrome p450 [Moniliophthora roreri]
MHESIQLALDMLESADNWWNHTHQQDKQPKELTQFTTSEIASIIYNKPSLQTSHDPIIPFLGSVIGALSDACVPGKYLVNHMPFLEYFPEFLAKWKRESKEKHQIYSEKFLSLFLSVKETVLQKQEKGPSFVATLIENQEQHRLNDMASAWLAAMLYLAGYETVKCLTFQLFDWTASALGWLTLAMIIFPEAQRKAQEELDTVVG